MSEVVIASDIYTIKDTDGNVILQAPIMDLYYLIALATDEAGTPSAIDKYKYAANRVNAEYGCNLSWGSIHDLLDALDKEVDDLKKKPTVTLESELGTDSILSS